MNTVSKTSSLECLTLTSLANRSMAQNAISWSDLEIALEHGKSRFSRGNIVCWVDDRTLITAGLGRDSQRLSGLYLIISIEGVIITAAWSRRITKRRGFKNRGS